MSNVTTEGFHHASKEFDTWSKNGRVYDTRISSERTANTIQAILKHLPLAKSADTSTSSRRQVKRKRARDDFVDSAPLCLESIVRKSEQHGFVQPLDALNSIYELIYDVLSVSDPSDPNYKQAIDVLRYLEKLNEEVEVKDVYGLCCTLNRALKPRSIACKGASCNYLIEIGNSCWECTSKNESEKIFICSSCHSRRSGDFISVRVKQSPDQHNMTNQFLTIEKHRSEFKRIKFKATAESEPTVKCGFCRKDHHTQCVMYDEYNWTMAFEKYYKGFSDYFRSLYVCQKCMKLLKSVELGTDPNAKVETYQFHPADMKSTRTSEAIEESLKTFLTSAEAHGYNPADKIYVREVSTKKGIFEAKPNMKLEFQKNNRPYQWEYLQRSIMVFQDRHDLQYPIVLFNLIVHEYPATGAISLSYIDSVKMFEPQTLRRRVFQELIVSYLDTARDQGYKDCHFWVCPPQTGEEYVFYGRPEEIHRPYNPGQDSGIVNWYKEMLAIALSRGVADKYAQVSEHCRPYDSHLDIPYLCDDMWPAKLEAILETYNTEIHNYESAKTARSSNRRRNPVKAKKHTCGEPRSLQSLINAAINECAGTYFSVKLVSNCEINQNCDEKDIYCPYMSNRDNFIVDCRENKYDFSTARRATFATLKMTSCIAKESFSTKCIMCEKGIMKGIYCYRCPEKSVYCFECAESLSSHEHTTLRQFEVPMVGKKIRPDQVFQIILKLFAAECIYLTNLSRIMTNPAHTTNSCNSEFLVQAKIIKEHKENLHTNGHMQRQTKCRACAATWLPLLRHKEFCKGRACYVPSCTRTPLFDNLGLLVQPDAITSNYLL